MDFAGEQVTDLSEAIALYKHLTKDAGAIDERKKVLKAAIQQAFEAAGGDHFKGEAGSCGWTKPTTLVIDKEKWMALQAADEKLAKRISSWEAGIEASEKQAAEYRDAIHEEQLVQECLVVPKSAFYIR